MQKVEPNIKDLDMRIIYQQALIEQNFNYSEGHSSIYKEAIKILNENIEMKNVSFISLVNKLKDKITITQKELSQNLKEPITCNRNVINLKGMKIKENKKRVLIDENEPTISTFEEEKLSNENEPKDNHNPFFSHTYKKIKDF